MIDSTSKSDPALSLEARAYEIVDSIPMEEIVSIQFGSLDKSRWELERHSSFAQPNTLAARLLRPLLSVMDGVLQKLVGDAGDDDADSRPKPRDADRLAFERRPPLTHPPSS